MIIAFETLEAVRVKHYLKADGILLVNEEKILPMPCITGVAKYPEDIKEKLTAELKGAKFVDAKAIAKSAGSEKATNIVMLGGICKLYGFDKEKMEEAVIACVPEKFKELIEGLEGHTAPKFLDLNKTNASIKVIANPTREDVDFDFEEHLIVELYSK